MFYFMISLQLCAKPETLCDEILEKVCNNIKEEMTSNQTTEVISFIVMRVNFLLGEIATKLLNYLDDNVYKELSRRNNIRDERNNTFTNSKKKKRKSVQNCRASLHRSASTSTIADSINQVSIFSDLSKSNDL